ncbi:MAG: hypothetical protein M1573_02300 [Candidatus Parvarchaeota archaeon]|nr:hypothetical protein [Candidatus Parvarchaeota archaeon]
MDQPQQSNPSVVKVMPAAPKRRIGRGMIVIIAIIVLLAVAYVMYHFNIAGVRVFVKRIISPLPVTTFSGVTSFPQMVKTSITQAGSAPYFNLSYTATVGLSIAGASILSLPFNLSAAKAGNDFRASFAANISSLLSVFSSFLNTSSFSNSSSSNSSKLKVNKINPIINGVTIYNSTGLINCNSVNSTMNCTYSKSFIPTKILPNETGLNIPSTFNISELESFTGISVKYKGVENYSGDECSILALGSDSSNLSISGTVCVSNSLGIPLSGNIQLASTSTSSVTSGFTYSIVFSSKSGSIPTVSSVTSLPKNAVLSK